MTQMPDIKHFNDLAERWRKDCLAIARCDARGWIELRSGVLATEGNSPAYTLGPHGGYEMICTTGNEHVYWTLDNIPAGRLRNQNSGNFTAISFVSDIDNAGSSKTVVSMSSTTTDNRGWAYKTEHSTTNNVAFTKRGVADIQFTDLNTNDNGGDWKYLCARVRDNVPQMFTDAGHDPTGSTGTTSSFNYSNVDRLVLGGRFNSGTAFGEGARCGIGPYFILFERPLDTNELIAIVKNPFILIEPEVPIYRRIPANAGGGPVTDTAKNLLLIGCG